jgi:hypothetical protein
LGINSLCIAHNLASSGNYRKQHGQPPNPSSALPERALGEIPKVQPSVLGDLTQNFFAAFPFFSPSLVLRLKDYGYYGSVISVEFIT